MSILLELAAKAESSLGADRKLFCDAFRAVFPEVSAGALDAIDAWDEKYDRFCAMLDVGAWLDAAMTLLPKTAINVSLNQFGRGWNARFHDTAKKMGDRAAHEQIERMFPMGGNGYQIAGEPRVVLEKAIAEHWLEFYCPCAATPALAVCAAALRAHAHTIKGASGGE